MRVGWLTVLCFVMSVVFVLPVPTWAWRAKRFGGSSVTQRPLSKYQVKNVVTSAVSKLFKAPLLKGAELPLKVTLANLQIGDSSLGVSSEQYTDYVLNEMLNNPRILIVNQDLKTDLSLTYKLMHYLPDFETRQKGILLGADYYISGSLNSKMLTNAQGKEKKFLESTLVLSNIRSNVSEIKVSHEHSLEHLKKR